MGTRVVECADRAVDVEQDNAAAIDEGQFALAWREFIDRANRYLTTLPAPLSSDCQQHIDNRLGESGF